MSEQEAWLVEGPDFYQLFGLKEEAETCAEIRGLKLVPLYRRQNLLVHETRIPGIKAKHAIITPTCRENRGVMEAFEEAAQRLRESYYQIVHAKGVCHLVLTQEFPDADGRFPEGQFPQGQLARPAECPTEDKP